jgi:hypothetical protein
MAGNVKSNGIAWTRRRLSFMKAKGCIFWGIGMLNYFQLLAKMPIFFRYVGLMT